MLLFFILCQPCHAQLTKRWFLNNGKSLNFDFEPPRLEKGSRIGFDPLSTWSYDLNYNNIKDEQIALIRDSFRWTFSDKDTAKDKLNLPYNSNHNEVAFEKLFGYFKGQNFYNIRTYEDSNSIHRISLKNSDLGTFNRLYQADIKHIRDNHYKLILSLEYRPKHHTYHKSYLRIIDFDQHKIVDDQLISLDQVKSRDTFLTCQVYRILDITNNLDFCALLYYRYCGRTDLPHVKTKHQGYLISGNLATSDVTIIKDLLYSKRNVQPDGNFYAYDVAVREPTSGAYSPNDSFFYTVHRGAEKVYQGRSGYSFRWNGDIVISRFSTNNYALLDTFLIPKEPSFYRYELFTRHNLEIAPNGNIYFIRSNGKNKSCLVKISKPNKAEPLSKKVTSNIYNIDTNTKTYSQYTLPKSNKPYKKLRFLQGKRSNCDDTLRYFADADPYYTSFEWEVMNDTGGFDVFKGKNVHYPTHGKKDFYIKVKGISDNGYFAWYSDSVTINSRPHAAFASDTAKWCQWVGLQMKNTTTTNWGNINYTWQLLQNDSIVKTIKGKEPYLTFNKTGNFDIRLIASIGSCHDTFTQKAAINIIEAPKPGFAVQDSLTCWPDTVFIIDKSEGPVSKRKFSWSDGHQDSSRQHQRIFTQNGQYKINQELLGPTGCVTKDSAFIRIIRGIQPEDSILAYTTEVVSEGVKFHWQTHPEARGYYYYRDEDDGIFLRGTNRTEYIDSTTLTQSQHYVYRLAAVDSCYRSTPISNPITSLLLQSDNQENQLITLTWNPFEQWQEGVLHYDLQTSDEGQNWQSILQSQQLNHLDDRAELTQKDSIYYRLIAIEKDGNSQQAISNVLKEKLLPLIFIPNAFSPNGDGTNDTFTIGTFGITQIHCQIYTKTGQRIFDQQGDYISWNGRINESPLPIGEYYYIIKATSAQGREITRTGMIALIR